MVRGGDDMRDFASGRPYRGVMVSLDCPLTHSPCHKDDVA